ncbi:hypothetical protein WNY59_08345 [Ahrensia kielensis]|uniref:Uncharacterized protein n=1 Tax=Ahrensia kielensis TaxID=76980 RepID=A0ABU9T629_9HYPH
MQLAKQLEINERQCPVPDNVLGDLRKSNPAEAALIASTLPELQRVQLAAFCYKRNHLKHLSIMIAATCELQGLVSAMGPAGVALYDQSRDPYKAVADLQASAGETARRAISLASFGNKTRTKISNEMHDSSGVIVTLN